MTDFSLASRALQDIVLRRSARGMAQLAPYLPPDAYARAAKALTARRGTVLLITGFCVAGAPETDGPPGTLCLAKTLQALGYSPVIVTDTLCSGLFDTTGIPAVCMDHAAGPDAYRALLDAGQPCAMISVERCGRNSSGDYANMRGESIAPQTAPLDILFELAPERGIYTVGIGDGGNEIGMGSAQRHLAQITGLDPCVIPADELLIATVSNWGAYALSAMLCACAGQPQAMPDYEAIADYILFLVRRGCVDGMSRIPENKVDGFPPEVDREIYTDIITWLAGCEVQHG